MGGRTPFDWLADPYTRRGNLRLVRRAIREGWPMPPEARAALGRALAAVALEDETTARELVSAALALLAMDGAEAGREAERPPNPPEAAA